MKKKLLDAGHRLVWQRIPRETRRAMLFSAARLLAPVITPRAQPAAPFIIVGALRAATGLGESARLCHDALKVLGLPVYGVDIGSVLRQQDGVPFEFEDGRQLTGTGTLILHVNAPMMSVAMLALPRTIVRDKHVVGYWAWELPSVPDDWLAGLQYVHEVWVPSEFTARAVEKIAGLIPVLVVPHPVAIRVSIENRRFRACRETFQVITIFNMASSFERKNVLGAIAAFKLAFGDNPWSQLFVKCTNADAYADGAKLLREACRGSANVTLHVGLMTSTEMADLYDRADVLISLHRSEGFGLTVAEAMLAGLAVVATNWSGNVDFLSEETGVPISYDLVPAHDAQDTYNFPDMSWAEPRIKHAAAELQKLRGDPERLRRLGQNAARFAREVLGAETYGRVLKAQLPTGSKVPTQRTEPREALAG